MPCFPLERTRSHVCNLIGATFIILFTPERKVYIIKSLEFHRSDYATFTVAKKHCTVLTVDDLDDLKESKIHKFRSISGTNVTIKYYTDDPSSTTTDKCETCMFTK